MSTVVADLSHHNWDNGMIPDFGLSKSAGLAGIIFKASQGGSYRDPRYEQTRYLAREVGLMWGAYHFGTSANAKSQVENFLAAAKPDERCLLCLDFEKNELDPVTSINLDIAQEFLDIISQHLGLLPRIYTGPYMYDLFDNAAQPALTRYKVWWARYADEPDLHPTWNKYWLWQYTDGHSGPKPHKFAGIGFCDLSIFDGTLSELEADWTP